MQKAITKALDWGDTHKFHFAPEKTQAIFFTHKNIDYDTLDKIKINGTEIHYRSEIKYLGVTLDSRLTR